MLVFICISIFIFIYLLLYIITVTVSVSVPILISIAIGILLLLIIILVILLLILILIRQIIFLRLLRNRKILTMFSITTNIIITVMNSIIASANEFITLFTIISMKNNIGISVRVCAIGSACVYCVHCVYVMDVI